MPQLGWSLSDGSSMAAVLCDTSDNFLAMRLTDMASSTKHPPHVATRRLAAPAAYMPNDQKFLELSRARTEWTQLVDMLCSISSET